MARRWMLPAALYAVVSYARPWDGPEPTRAALIDKAVEGWSPRPTHGVFNEMVVFMDQSYDGLMPRQEPGGGQTCGYIDGLSESARVCAANYICVTNYGDGAAGCCDSSIAITSCQIPTSCVPSSLMSVSCTDSVECLNNIYVTKCTDAASPDCFGIAYDYVTTTMTELGCSNTNLFLTAEITYIGEAAPSTSTDIFGFSNTGIDTNTDTYTDSFPTYTYSSYPSSSPTPYYGYNDAPRRVALGIIIGPVVAGVIILAIIIGVTALLCTRQRRRRRENEAIIAQARQSNPQFANYGQGPPQQEVQQQQPFYSPQQSPPPQQMAQHGPPQMVSPGAAAAYYGTDVKPNEYPQQTSVSPGPPSTIIELGGGTNPNSQLHTRASSPGNPVSPGHVQHPSISSATYEAGGQPVPYHYPPPQGGASEIDGSNPSYTPVSAPNPSHSPITQHPSILTPHGPMGGSPPAAPESTVSDMSYTGQRPMSNVPGPNTVIHEAPGA